MYGIPIRMVIMNTSNQQKSILDDFNIWQWCYHHRGTCSFHKISIIFIVSPTNRTTSHKIHINHIFTYILFIWLFLFSSLKTVLNKLLFSDFSHMKLFQGQNCKYTVYEPSFFFFSLFIQITDKNLKSFAIEAISFPFPFLHFFFRSFEENKEKFLQF